MIFPETLLTINDNCGAKTVKCIKILHNKFPGKVGEFCYCCNQKVVIQKKSCAPGEIHLAVITKTKKTIISKEWCFFKNFFK